MRRWPLLAPTLLLALTSSPAAALAQAGAELGTPPTPPTDEGAGAGATSGEDAADTGAEAPPGSAEAAPPADAGAPAAEPAAPADGPDYPVPARTTLPTFLPFRLPHREIGASLGVSTFQAADLTSVASGLYFETTNGNRRFMMRLGLPFAAAGDAMVGDFDMEFGVLLWAEQDGAQGANYLTVSFDFTLPFALLNTLGGEAMEIHDRRIRKYPGVSAQAMLPIRYLQFMPHVGYARRQGPFLFYANAGGILLLACQYANYFEAPTVEGVLQYGAGAAAELYASADDAHSVAVGLELSVTQFVTQVAAPDATPGVHASSDDRRDRDAGLSLAPSLHARIARRFVLDTGFAFALAGDQTWSRYTPSTLWRHDWTFFLQAGLGF